MTYVLHANWSGGRLHLWAEAPGRSGAVPAEELRGALAAPALDQADLELSELTLRLPTVGGEARPSTRMARVLGRGENGAAGVIELGQVRVGTLAVAPAAAGRMLDAIADAETDHATLVCSAEVEFFAAVARLALHLLAQQRFVPMLMQERSGELRGAWQPWLNDAQTATRLGAIVRSMPPAARAVEDVHAHDPWAIVEDMLLRLTDSACRAVLVADRMGEAISERDPAVDPHVAWLGGLLDGSDRVRLPQPGRQDMVRRVRTWIGALEERGSSASWRLCLRVHEPDAASLSGMGSDKADEHNWTISFHLQSVDRPSLLVDAADLWLLPTDTLTLEGRRIDAPQELLLKELSRASRLFSRLDAALHESKPSELSLSTRPVYQFLREVRPVLVEQGFGVIVPEWWDSPMARLGARLKLDSDATPPVYGAGPGAAAGASRVGLGAIVKYRWEIAVGDTTLTLQEFEQLAARKSPLVRIHGRWVEVRPEDVQAAVRFMRENPGGNIGVGEALRMAYAMDAKQLGISVLGLDATGWVKALLEPDSPTQVFEIVEPPVTFLGTLRPYQVRGVSWMAFLERLGFGVCLADDMGLGKTIQLLALLAFEREQAKQAGTGTVAPTLLVVPMSVVGNWLHETKRFCPSLKVLLHHGAERLQNEALLESVLTHDLIVTTYALAHRDREQLERAEWGRIVLDEAQYIKNPVAKQTQAVRSIPAARRVALTGTPVENRLSELWSIMDFLNPGYMGSAHAFRTRFAVPIERFRDKTRGEQLRGMVRPVILRRLKTDPNVVADLPEKIETREFSHLTSEQAMLYETCVRRMLGEVDRAEGIARRGLVLAALIRLKQICNHPAQLLKDFDPESGVAPDPSRSGKCVRILEMLDEVLAEGDKALIFTQFRQMGALLAPMLRHELGRDVLFLHGGTTQVQREQIIQSFQKPDQAHPILILSLKAGGVGLNLTAATHVFHFDRWWNPAVENQATDRAYRIGQTRTVQVHKFVVRGTLEERIDQMIEQKTELAENIIGAGERWLTELSTDQLRDILTLRKDAVGDDV